MHWDNDLETLEEKKSSGFLRLQSTTFTSLFGRIRMFCKLIKFVNVCFLKACEKILLELLCHTDSIPFQQKVSKSVSGRFFST